MNSITAYEAFDFIINQQPEVEFLVNSLHISAEELAKLVKKLRLTAQYPQKEVVLKGSQVIDFCGTGGAASFRLNTSTLCSFFASELGFKVTKHGGRSASGKVGSLDLLESFGIHLETQFKYADELLRSYGVVFLGAGFTYPSFGRWGSVRKQYGKPSIFNLLGPLLNPVPLNFRLLGTFHPDVANKMARTLSLLGESGLVVCSEDLEGFLDDASPYGKTIVYHVCSLSKVQYAELEAIDSLPMPRQDLFASAVKCAQELLKGGTSASDVVASKLICYNLALIIASQHHSLSSDIFSDSLIKTYHALRKQFDFFASKVVAKISAIQGFKPVHPASPTLIPAAHLVSKEQTIVSHLAPPPSPSISQESSILIAEVKLKTPLREFHSAVSLSDRVSAYQKHAHVISVVTHPQFGGSVELLKKVRSLTHLPILAKDFVNHESQIQSLAGGGANFVLLLLDMLGKTHTQSLIKKCIELGVEPWVETSWDPRQVATFFDGTIVFNSRNLFSLNESTSYRNTVLHQLPAALKKRVVIASGARNPLDVKILKQGSKGVIVGTYFMNLSSLASLEMALAECASHRPLLKACGARSLDDIEMAFQAKFDWIGVNLLPISKRRATSPFLRQLSAITKEQRERICLLTDCNTSPEDLFLLRDYGFWEQAYSFPLCASKSGVFVPIQNPVCLKIPMTLGILDSQQPGSGETWEIPEATESEQGVPVLLAGGLTPGNLTQKKQDAIHKKWNLLGFDVASFLENQSKSGFDSQKLKQFAQRANSII